MNLAGLKYVCDHAGSGILPVLAFLLVYDNEAGERRAQTGNGRYVVDVPCDLPLCCVNADRVVSAWAACKGDEVTVKATGANLMVSAGRVKARIPLADPSTYPRAHPEPKQVDTAPGIAALLTRLQPFVATDASRAWATSLCLKGGFAYATNNVILCRVPFPADVPFPVNVPRAVFDAITDKGEPTGMGWAENAITFYFEDGTWIRTQLITGDWPTHVVDKYVDGLGEEWDVPHPELGLMLNTAFKVSESKHPVVEFNGSGLRLTDDAFEADELMPLPQTGKVLASMARIVFDRATEVQWHSPKPNVHAFRVDDITGVFAGQL